MPDLLALFAELKPIIVSFMLLARSDSSEPCLLQTDCRCITVAFAVDEPLWVSASSYLPGGP
jgi:hypothetical protein